MKPNRTVRAFLSSLCLLTACSDSKPPTLRLLDPTVATDAETERMHKMQAVTVFNTETKLPEEIPRLDIYRFAVSPACNDPSRVPGGCAAPSPNSCTYSLCQAAANACIAKTFLALTKPQATPITFGVWSIPQQKAAAKADLADFAMSWAALGADQFAMALESMSGTPRQDANQCGTGATGATLAFAATNGATFAAAGFKELYDVYREAAAVKIQAALDTSDAELNSSSSLALASQRSMLNWRLGVAASAAGATADKLLSTDTGAFCSSAPPREQARAAIAIFRDAAVPPNDLFGAITTADLLNGTTLVAPNGSVRQRVAQFYGKPELLDTTIVPRIEDYYNLDLSAFEDARKILKEEIVTFSRSRLATLPKRTLPDGSLATIDSYAGTASAPGPVPAAYYSALGRTNDTGRVTYEHPYTAGSSFYVSVPEFNNDMEGFSGAAKNLLNLTKNLAASVVNAASAPIGMMIADSDLLGHVAVNVGFFTYDFDVYGFDSTDNIRLVRGEDELRCAVQGSIEGAPCKISSVNPDVTTLPAGTYAVRPPNSTPPAHFGFTKSARFSHNSVPGSNRYYLVKPKASAGTSPVAGEYEALIGVTANFGAPYSVFSIVRGGNERLAQVLEPSRAWCARPRLTCDGAEFDERIPLENELASDGDGIESSWRHYLELAKEASARADQLGADYVAAGLAGAVESETIELRQQQQDRVADQYLQRLQNICGTQVDTRVLLSKLKDASGLNIQTTGGTCATTANCTSGHGAWSCQQSRCVLDIGKLLATFKTQDPDVQRLADCLSQSTTTPFVSLGNLPLCVWYDQANKNLVCGGASPGDCPVVKPEKKTCVQAITLPPSVTTPQIAAETKPLGYFDISQDAGSTSDAVDLYASVADNALTPAWWRINGPAIVAANILDPWRLSPYAQRLNWEARFGGFAAITLDGATIWQSGSPWVGVQQNAWPCTSAMSPPGPDSSPVLRDCSDPVQRNLANQDMVRAVLAAKAMASDYDDKFQATLDSIPFASRCSGDLESRDSFTYYGAGEGVIRHSKSDGQEYVWIPNYLFNYFPGWVDDQHPINACFRSGKFSVEGGGILSGRERVLSGMYAGSQYNPWFSADFGGTLAMYLNGEAGIGADTELNQATYSDALLIKTDGTDPDGRLLSLTVRDYLTALRLMAGIARRPAVVSLTTAPRITTVDDLENASQYLSLLAHSIQSVSGRAVFANIPDKVLDALRAESAVGSYPQFGGEMGEAISTGRAALLKIHENGPLISNEVEQMGYDLRALKLLLQKSEIRKDLSKLQFISTMTSQIASCAADIAGVGTLDVVGAAGKGVAAQIKCANSLAQIDFAQGIANLEATDAKLDADIAVSNFGAVFARHATALQTLSLHLAEAQEDLDIALTQIEKLRNEATSQLSSALYASSEQAAHQAEVTNVIGNLYAGKQIRYTAALSNARRMTFLAKRAIEQRLGIRLAEMSEDLPLVEAPQKWEATACTFAGVNYAALKVADGAAPLSYAEGFIGDYVAKLENVVESYRLQHDFHEGSDTAVISMKDDIFSVRKKCAVVGANLLYDAGQLDRTLERGWKRDGCETEVVDGATVPKADCIRVSPSATGSGPVFTDPTTSAAASYTINFGTPASGTNPGVYQPVRVEPGVYRLSWYTTGSLSTGGAASGGYVNIDATLGGSVQGSGPSVNGWYRRYKRFSVTKGGQIKVGFTKVTSGIIEVAAPMLERLSTDTVDEEVAFVPFVNTGANLEQLQPACADSDGSVFRSTRWQRECMKLCPDGFGQECTGDRAKSYCYWQADFNINQRDIQQGRVFNFSGFARGNYNYRIDSVALNFVGSGRNCQNAAAPEACYSAGFVPYSLSHVGPFVVRNHLGADVPANLFDGNIEHARGLATERYITNPLSDADKSLIGQYTRLEFQGRPLDGNFALRIWEEPGVDFSSIQDVQVIFNYRYWTKFN